MGIKETTSTSKINILTKATLDSLDLSQHTNEIFYTTDEIENGTDITINGEKLSTWSADFVENEKAISGENNSNPIVHNNDDSVVFAESERQKSKNLFDKDSVLRGRVLGYDGNDTANSSWWVSEYIDIQDINNLYLSGSRTSGSSVCFYDETKTFIVHTTPSNNTTGIITVPSNSKYVRLNGLLTELDGIQLEEGSVATEYQPYNGAIVHEKEIELLKQYPIEASVRLLAHTSGTAGSLFTIPFDQISYSSNAKDLIFLNTSTGEITFSNKVKRVKFNGIVALRDLTVGPDASLKKNDSEIYHSMATQGSFDTKIANCLFLSSVQDVSAGDVFRVCSFCVSDYKVNYYYTQINIEVYL